MGLPASAAGRILVQSAVVLAVVSLTVREVPTQSTSPAYGIYDVGTLGGATTEALAISEFGYTIAGRSQTTTGAQHAFVTSLTGEKDLGTLGGAESIALAASFSEVVGRSQTAAGHEHAFHADGYSSTAPMTDLGTLGGTWSSANDVRYGIIVGASRTAGDARLQAFVHRGGAMAPLAIDFGGDSDARGVNANDDIVGYACTAGNASCTAFLFTGGVATSLGSLGGNSVANRINDSLQVVGTSFLADGTTTRAFLHQNAAMVDLGTLGGTNSEGLSINGRGEVVGSAQDASGAPRAFLWRNGVMIDLNSVLPAGSGWVLTTASGISEGGQIVGTGLLNGVKKGFLLTPDTDLEVRIGGVRSQSDSNLPRGVEVGKTIRVVLSLQVATADQPIALYGARLTDTLTGPAEYVSAQGYDDANCAVTARVVTCDFLPLDAIGVGREVMLTIRATAPGPISHQAVVTSAVPDSHPGNDTATEANYAVALTTLALTPSTIAGGKPASARVTLTGIAPGGDAVVRMFSSRPDIAPVPETFVVPSWTDKREFNIVPAVVAQPTTVEITASYGLVTETAMLTVLPPALSQMYLTPTTIVGGCGTSAGKIVLTGAAPAGGGVVALSNTNANFNLPPSITVAEGTTTSAFTVTTNAVTSPTVGTVTASYGGANQTLTVTVRPIRAKTLVLSPGATAGGSSVTGTITLECPAAPGGVVVSLSSNNPTAASPTVPSVTIPAGETTASFTVQTSEVSSTTSLTIYATVFGVRKGTALTLTP